MAKITRSGAPARGNGKLALFEVIQSAQADGDGGPAVVPLGRTQGADRRDAAASPAATPSLPRLRPAGVTDAPEKPRGRSSADPTRESGSKPLLVTLSALAAVAVLGAVFVVGRLTSGDAAEAVSHSRPDPSVLDVPPDARAAASAFAPAVLANASGQALASPAVRSSATPLVGSPRDATPVAVAGVRRTFGLNYVLIESYHASEEDRAVATRDALLKNGVNVTIERGVPGWGKRLCVVGTLGFERIRGNDALRDYTAKIKSVSDLYRNDRTIKAFDPLPIRWSQK